MSQQLTVMLVDDHPMWREGVSRDLDDAGFTVVATAFDAHSARARAKATIPAVVLMDMQLIDSTGVDATIAVLSVSPSSKVLVLSASDERADVLAAVKAGASGYLVKSASRAELVDAVRATADGHAIFTPGLAGLVLGAFAELASAAPADEPPITNRETEVLRLVAKGLSSRQIASRLQLSPRTVENHVQSTLRKLQLANRVELTRYAIEHGLDD